MIKKMNRHQRRRRRRRQTTRSQRGFVIEALKPRILLSADPTHFLGVLGDGMGGEFVLQGSPGERFGQGGVVLLDSSGDPVWGSSIVGTAGEAAFGWAVENVGDVNGDSFDDFQVGAPGEVSEKGEVSLRSGADGALLLTLQGEVAEDRFWFSIDSIGDLDGNGQSDYAIGSPGARRAAREVGGAAVGGVSVLSGDWMAKELAGTNPDGAVALAYTFVHANLAAGAEFGWEIAAAGDILEGIAGTAGVEFFVGAPGGTHGRVDLLGLTPDLNGDPVLASRAFFQTDEADFVDARAGAAIATIGDVDSGGVNDLLIGAPDSHDGGGTVAILRGEFFVAQVTGSGGTGAGDDVLWSMAGSEDRGFAGTVVSAVSDAAAMGQERGVLDLLEAGLQTEDSSERTAESALVSMLKRLRH